MSVGVTPVPIAGTDARTHLAYELQVTEVAGLRDITMERLEILDERNGASLLTYDAGDLDGRTMRPGAKRDVRYGRVVPRGETVVVHVWMTMSPGQVSPPSLRHRLSFSAASTTQPVAELLSNVGTQAAVSLGPPLRGGLWLAHNGPGAHRAAHWGSVWVDSGRTTIPQRYAIDFIGLDDAGKAVRRSIEGSSNADWVGFGADVIAVADGIVQEARDGLEDWVPLYEPPPPAGMSLRDAGGNYVVLELASGTFANYVHLQKGSVVVKLGQRVQRGALLGRVGNSGNTNAPHLHFNMVDAVSMEIAEGIPFVFDLVQVYGTTTVDAAFGAARGELSPPMTLRRSMPLDDAIIRFP
jgi:hypothetical protein